MKNYQQIYNKTGLLLVNLGSPDAPRPKEVKRYLKQFLSDQRVIEANRFLWFLILRGIILPIRSKKSAKAYQKVWFNQINQSPLIYYTAKQAEQLAAVVQEDYIVDYAMRYGNPSIESALNNLQAQGATTIKVLPLYPQYSATTTASVYDTVYQVIQQWRWQPTIQGIAPYYDHPAYIEALVNQTITYLDQLDFSPDTIVTSFHGIPKQYFDAGDPYYCHCHKTYRLYQERLTQKGYNVSVELAFQSRFGPKEWLQPYTQDVLKQQVTQGKKNVVVITPGFPSDCLETLEEIALEEKNNFINAGGQRYATIPCLNDSMEHIQMLQTLAGS